MKFYRAVASGASIPLDGEEMEKVMGAILSQKGGILVLKQGIIDLRSPVHIAPDTEREKRYWDSSRLGRDELKENPDVFSEEVKQLAAKMNIKSLPPIKP